MNVVLQFSVTWKYSIIVYLWNRLSLQYIKMYTKREINYNHLNKQIFTIIVNKNILVSLFNSCTTWTRTKKLHHQKTSCHVFEGIEWIQRHDDALSVSTTISTRMFGNWTNPRTHCIFTIRTTITSYTRNNMSTYTKSKWTKSSENLNRAK